MNPEIADVLAGRRRWCVPVGDCREVLASMPDGCARCCVTSPPYWGLRDYGVDGQLGLEPTPEEYVANMVEVFREVRRVLTDDGTLWLNLGDSYVASACGVKHGGVSNSSGLHGAGQVAYRETLASGHAHAIDKTRIGLAPKNLVGIPWRVAFALQADGWWLRQDIIWAKPNPMPESVTDRCTKAHEYIFLLAKAERYFYDAEAIAERSITGDPRPAYGAGQEHAPGSRPSSGTRSKVMPPIGGVKHAAAVGGTYSGEQREAKETRNARSVWSISPQPFKEAHFATMPPTLADRCVRTGSAVGDLVIDPFNGAGTTGLVSVKHGRRYVGPELNPEYADIARRRIADADTHLFTEAGH